MSGAVAGFAAALASLRALLDGDELCTQGPAIAQAGGDLFEQGTAPCAVVRPRAAAKVSALLAILADHGVPFVPGGGGTSYSAANFLDVPEWVLVDTAALDRIVEINATDSYVTVEAGCTWATLHAALAEQRLRTPFWGPYSGRHATVGGALSQHAVFYGSARHGASAGSVLGLTAARPDGGLIRTGSAGLAGRPTPFLRDCGPDLTGPFLGDCGALGIKLEATLRLIRAPAATRYLGIAFADTPAMVAAMAEIAASGLVSDCIGTALAGQALLGLVVEGRSGDDVAEAAALAQEAGARSGGVATDEGLLAAMHRAPFGPLTMLGPAEGRWVPVHAIVPHSRHLAALRAIEAVLARREEHIRAHGIAWSVASLAVGAGAVLVEPGLRWPGRPNPRTDAFLTETGGGALPRGTGAAQSAVAALRAEIAGELAGLGAVNLQIGRRYPYRSRLDPGATKMLDALRRQGDPRGLGNPGVLDA